MDAATGTLFKKPRPPSPRGSGAISLIQSLRRVDIRACLSFSVWGLMKDRLQVGITTVWPMHGPKVDARS